MSHQNMINVRFGFTSAVFSGKLSRMNKYTASTVFILFIASCMLAGCAVGYKADRPVLESGGLKVNNILYTPSDMEPGVRYPGVVINHGGSEGVEFATKGWARALARKGYVVIMPQFRGQGGSEGQMEFAQGEVDDSLSALKYLKGLPYVDSNRIGMVGYSLGGLITLSAMERAPEVKAAVLVSSITDPVEFFRHRMKGKMKGGLPQSGVDMGRHVNQMHERSPMARVADVNASVLIIHGLEDRMVSPEQARLLYSALKAAGKDVELILHPEIGHAVTWYPETMYEAIGYLDRHIGRTQK